VTASLRPRGEGPLRGPRGASNSLARIYRVDRQTKYAENSTGGSGAYSTRRQTNLRHIKRDHHNVNVHHRPKRTLGGRT